jgi:nucleotide-binding universal stress UspA family protein
MSVTIQRILVPVDFSACSRTAVEYAAVLARQFRASVDLLHIWEPPQYVDPEGFAFAVAPSDGSLVEFSRSQAGREMDRLLTELHRYEVRQVGGRIETGEAVEEILKVLADGKYDLAVMGTHGRTGLAHLLMGSVAEKVMRRAPCPVLTVRAPAVETTQHEGVQP